MAWKNWWPEFEDIAYFSCTYPNDNYNTRKIIFEKEKIKKLFQCDDCSYDLTDGKLTESKWYFTKEDTSFHSQVAESAIININLFYSFDRIKKLKFKKGSQVILFKVENNTVSATGNEIIELPSLESKGSYFSVSTETKGFMLTIKLGISLDLIQTEEFAIEDYHTAYNFLNQPLLVWTNKEKDSVDYQSPTTQVVNTNINNKGLLVESIWSNYTQNSRVVHGIQSDNITNNLNHFFRKKELNNNQAGWKCTTYSVQSTPPTEANQYITKIPRTTIFQQLDMGGFAYFPVILSESFSGNNQEQIRIQNGNLYIGTNSPIRIPNIEDYNLYTICRKSVTQLTKGLSAISSWEDKDKRWPSTTGYSLITSDVMQSTVGVWVKETTTLELTTTSSLMFSQISINNKKEVTQLININSANIEITEVLLENGEISDINSNYITTNEMSDLPENHFLRSCLTNYGNFNYTITDILPQIYQRNGEGNQAILSVRHGYEYMDDNRTEKSGCDKSLNLKININNFSTIPSCNRIQDFLNTEIKTNSFYWVGNSENANETPARALSATGVSVCYYNSIPNLLPKSINLLEGNLISGSNIKDITCGTWSWLDVFGPSKDLYSSNITYPYVSSVTSTSQGSTYAKFAGYSLLVAFSNTLGMSITSDEGISSWEFPESNEAYAFAIVVAPKDMISSPKPLVNLILPNS